MQKFRLYVFTALLAVGGWVAACNGDAQQTQKETDAADFGSLGMKMFSDSLPAGAQQIPVGFRDMNAYTSNGYFCIVSRVDNGTDLWQKIWVKSELLDAEGNTLSVEGDTSLLLQTFSDAVPPRGATSFFCAIPLDKVSGVPVNCRLEGAGAIPKSAGPILLATDIGGVRAMYPDKKDSVTVKVVEQIFMVQGAIENPLNLTAYHPKIVFLVYGNDTRLYFAQMIDPEKPNPSFRQDGFGPLNPQDKRPFTYQIHYEMLPDPLKEMLIGRVDVEVFESR